MVGLETDLAGESRLDLTLVAARAGEENTAELGLNEELGVELAGGRVKRQAGHGRIYIVGGGNRVCGEQPDSLELVEFAGIVEASKDLIDGVEGFGDETVRSSLGRYRTECQLVQISRQNPMLTSRTTEEELHLRSAGAVADSDGTSEGDKVARSDAMLLDEWLLQIHDLIETNVWVEVGLNVVEDHDGAVSAPATELTLRLHGGGDGNGVMEDTKGSSQQCEATKGTSEDAYRRRDS